MRKNARVIKIAKLWHTLCFIQVSG